MSRETPGPGFLCPDARGACKASMSFTPDRCGGALHLTASLTALHFTSLQFTSLHVEHLTSLHASKAPLVVVVVVVSVSS